MVWTDIVIDWAAMGWFWAPLGTLRYKKNRFCEIVAAMEISILHHDKLSGIIGVVRELYNLRWEKKLL